MSAIFLSGLLASTAQAGTFNYSGSSGDETILNNKGGNSTCFAVTGVNSGQWVVSGVTAENIMSKLLPTSDCSAVKFVGYTSEAPTPYTGISAELIINKAPTDRAASGTIERVEFCDFNPGAAGGKTGRTKCTGKSVVDIKQGDQVAICFRASYAVAKRVKVSWNLRCNAK
ncbi:MAG: hypothetical protein GXP03_00460 [Alphaproteobacteria bacterium]|nr:hypothetical protein [Alphaproteobacteria bacterium]